MTAIVSAPLEIGEVVPFAQLARDRYAELRPSEQRVVDHLRELDPASSVATVGAVAVALGVSQATVVNAVQRLDYEGFGAFRRARGAQLSLVRALAEAIAWTRRERGAEGAQAARAAQAAHTAAVTAASTRGDKTP